MLDDPRLRAGLEWGAPRFGHPEGRVGEHVATMLAAIPSDDPLRGDLRFLALTHDSFKSEVRPHQRLSPDTTTPRSRAASPSDSAPISGC